MQHQWDQQSPDTTIAVEERVDRFELHVRNGGHHHHGIRRCRVVERTLQPRHQVLDKRGRWRYEVRVAWPGAADPVLGSSELTRLFFAAATAREQLRVHLANQPIREWKSL